MAKVKLIRPGVAAFKCPGCGDIHEIPFGRIEHPTWNFNGDMDKPTFSPSILATAGHYCAHATGKDCWCTYEKEYPGKSPFHCYKCHSFVTDGNIQFLSDCSHSLAGQTVDLEDINDG